MKNLTEHQKQLLKIWMNSEYKPFFSSETHFYNKEKADAITRDASKALKESLANISF